MSDDLRAQLEPALRDPNGDPYPTYKHDLWMLDRILPLVEQAIREERAKSMAQIAALHVWLNERISDRSEQQIRDAYRIVLMKLDALRETPAPPQEPT